MKTSFISLVLLSIFFQANAQVIKRWANTKSVINSRQMTCQAHPNVFEDYGWTYPDIKSKEIAIPTEGYEFNFKGTHYKLLQANVDDISVAKDGHIITTERLQKSHNDIYFNKKILKLKAVTKYKWVPYTYYQTTMVQVNQTRPVTSYQYDAVSHTSHPVYSYQNYTVLQSHMTPVFSNKWQAYTEYVPDVPVFDYYSLNLDNDQHLFLYKYQGKYYLQNPQYIQGTDEDKVNYILVDNDLNGSFTDPDDAMMVNSWNPYNKASKYKAISYTRENQWNNISYFATEEFVSPTIANGTLIIDSKNAAYEESNKKGRIYFENIPKGAKAIINGKSYNLHKEKDKFKIEYGVFNLQIEATGFLDFDTTFVVDEKNDELHITYKTPTEAAELNVKNIFSTNYYITVSNPSGFYKTYHNQNKIGIPGGNDSISVYMDGNSIPFHIQAKTGDKIDLDFEAELKKMTTESKENPSASEPQQDEKKEDTK